MLAGAPNVLSAATGVTLELSLIPLQFDAAFFKHDQSSQNLEETLC